MAAGRGTGSSIPRAAGWHLESGRVMPDPATGNGGRSNPILVIDDEPYILRAMSYLLSHEGFTVETASNGEEGLARARALRPPLVFLDIMMPKMDGYEVCEQIRQDASLLGTYV